MKRLLLLLIIVYSVRASDNGYFIVEQNEPLQSQFNVYWNIPTEDCHYSNYETYLEEFGILHNAAGSLLSKILIVLNSPGRFPSIDKNDVRINGGIPQLGSLNSHLQVFEEDVAREIPDESYDGIVVINVEAWSPIFRRNVGAQSYIKNLTYAYADGRRFSGANSSWDSPDEEFEAEARLFLLNTIRKAVSLRPNAKWGYYGWPYCHNIQESTGECSYEDTTDNTELSWLLSVSKALFPEVILRDNMTADYIAAQIKALMPDTIRRLPVIPILYLNYASSGNLLSEEHLNDTISALYSSGASGVIIKGSPILVMSFLTCYTLNFYLRVGLGPIIAQYTKSTSTVHEYGGSNVTSSTTIVAILNATEMFHDTIDGISEISDLTEVFYNITEANSTTISSPMSFNDNVTFYNKIETNSTVMTSDDVLYNETEASPTTIVPPMSFNLTFYNPIETNSTVMTSVDMSCNGTEVSTTTIAPASTSTELLYTTAKYEEPKNQETNLAADTTNKDAGTTEQKQIAYGNVIYSNGLNIFVFNGPYPFSSGQQFGNATLSRPNASIHVNVDKLNIYKDKYMEKEDIAINNNDSNN